tara:strand:+ start:71 stop:709 length:639 start_codon:yes stop_codon:yes gene_type:complete
MTTINTTKNIFEPHEIPYIQTIIMHGNFEILWLKCFYINSNYKLSLNNDGIIIVVSDICSPFHLKLKSRENDHISSIYKLKNNGWFCKLDFNFWSRFISLFDTTSLYIPVNLYLHGFMYKSLETLDTCHICKKTLQKSIILRCGCKYHKKCLKDYKKHECPNCNNASNLIKSQFKLSYTCPSFNLCQRRLKKDYEEICNEFYLINYKRFYNL